MRSSKGIWTRITTPETRGGDQIVVFKILNGYENVLLKIREVK